MASEGALIDGGQDKHDREKDRKTEERVSRKKKEKSLNLHGKNTTLVFKRAERLNYQLLI